MTLLKICGTTSFRDAELCDQLKTDFLGFIFYPPSKRYISLEAAKPIINTLGHAKPIGVFVKTPATEVTRIAKELNLWGAQVYEDQEFENPPCTIIRAFRIDSAVDIGIFLASQKRHPNDYFLLDTKHPTNMGGTGESFDWTLLPKDLSRVFLAGGITIHNVDLALQKHPFAIDLVSGVEVSPGVKDPQKVAAMAIAKSAPRR